MITDTDLERWSEDPWLFDSPITGRIDSFKEIQMMASELLQWRKLGREYFIIQQKSFEVGGNHPHLIKLFVEWDGEVKKLLLAQSGAK